MKRESTIKKRWSTDQLITGVELGNWMHMLKENAWNVTPEYLHRAAWVTAWSLPTTLVGKYEDAKYSRQLASMEIDPEPIFVLGHWRSGTTHTHNLLGRVPGHTYSTVFQCVFPTSFLSMNGVVPPLTERFMDATRSYDNVKHGWNEEAEDEIALTKLTGLSPYMSFMFPDSGQQYWKYVDFLEATPDERDRWKEAFTYFIKKIMLQTGGKRVIIKSCTHTARVRMLLDMFPNAKFVFIHRNPFEVFSSTLHMRSHTDWENFFHQPWEGWDAEREQQTILLGQRIFERFVEDRHLIPEKNYFEIAYSDLCGNEMQVMENLYSHLDLPNWDKAKPELESYVASLSGYQRNQLTIDDRVQDLVRKHWGVVFDTFGYDREYPPSK